MSDYIINLLSYGIIIPSSWLCIYPVKEKLRWNIPFKTFLFLTTIGISVIVVAVSFIDVTQVTHRHFIFYSILAILVAYYLYAFRIRKGVLLYLFAFFMCVYCSATLMSYFWDAYRYPDSNYEAISMESVLSQWVSVFIFSCIFIILFGRRLQWMIAHFKNEKMWYLMSVPSWIITLSTLIMVPQNYKNLFTGRLFSISIHVTLTLIGLFTITHLIFYRLTRSTYDKATLDKEKQLMSLQLHEVELQNKYINETHTLRHDLRHSVVTLISLLQNGENQEAIDYLSSYLGHIDSRQSYIEFCSYPALNALLNEYIKQAKSESIRVHHSINLPDRLSIDDAQLCILMGNLLNNAIQACKKISEPNRFIKIYIDSEEDSELYIIIFNSYDGEIIWDKSTISNIPPGHYGISSIVAITEENGGVARFATEDKVFRAEIMLPID